MAELHHIVFIVVMYVLLCVTFCYRVCYCCHFSNDQHLQRTQHFVFSSILMVIICVVSIILLANDGLNTATTWYYQALRLTNGISARFPTLWKLLLTLIGLFITFTLLRPKIKIGRIMVYIPRTQRVVVHVRNFSLFSAYNVSAKLYSVDETGDNKIVESLALEGNNQDKLEWCFAHSNQKDVEFATIPNDAKVMTVLRKVAEHRGVIEIRVTADHAISRVRRTIIQQFGSNDILVGLYRNGHFKTIRSINPFKADAYYSKQNIVNVIHKLFMAMETIVAMGIIVLFSLHIGGKGPIVDTYLIFDVLILSLFILELIRALTEMPIKTSFDNTNSFINHLN